MWSYRDSGWLWYRQAEHDHIFGRKDEGFLIVKWLVNAHTNINGNSCTIQMMNLLSIAGGAMILMMYMNLHYDKDSFTQFVINDSILKKYATRNQIQF
jgi:hypothetical protein